MARSSNNTDPICPASRSRPSARIRSDVGTTLSEATRRRDAPDPAPPPPPFRYIGYLGPKDDMIAVFDRGPDVVVARIGDKIIENFELLEFRHDAVVLRYTGEESNGETKTLERRPNRERKLRTAGILLDQGRFHPETVEGCR